MVTLSGGQIERAPDAVRPVLVGLAEHAGDEIDVDLRKAEVARLLVDARDLRRAVGAAVQLQDAIAEILDAEAQPGDADAANRRQLGTGDRAGLALERDLFGRLPRPARRHALDERLELTGRQERRRSAAEVHEIERPPGQRRLIRVELPLAPQQVEVLLDFLGVLVGVHPEVTEMTALTAKRDVEVHPERHLRRGRRSERHPGVRGDGVWRPDRKRRVIRDKVAADLGLLEVGDRRRIGHACTIPGLARLSAY